ncbi:MAG: diheme cytochrome c [Ramlibacter sp.]|nr:diheme cytochrome c [Ramlibacter sp.]
MNFSIHPSPAVLALFLALGLAEAAAADEGQRASSVPLAPKYRQECAACHLPYPPALLPAAAWRGILAGLPDHYGTDASLDAASTRELSAWLDAHAGTGKRARERPPEDRITRSAWFIRKHDEVPARTWKLPAVNSAAHCGACHPQAEQGDFDEHRVRLPR